MPWPEAEVAEVLSFETRCLPRIFKLSTLTRLTSIRTFIRSIVKVIDFVVVSLAARSVLEYAFKEYLQRFFFFL